MVNPTIVQYVQSFLAARLGCSLDYSAPSAVPVTRASNASARCGCSAFICEFAAVSMGLHRGLILKYCCIIKADVTMPIKCKSTYGIPDRMPHVDRALPCGRCPLHGLK